VDDVLGLIVLAMVTGLAANSVNYLDLALTAGLAIAFTLFVAWFGSRTVRRVMPRVQAKLVLAEREFALAMTLLFALSLLAVFAGIAAIIGAFLAGMALSESVDARVVDLTNGVTELLVHFFLVVIGMRLDPRALSGTSALLLGGAILLAAIVSKFIGCGLGALHMGRRDALRVAVGMIPRGEVGIVVAQ